MREKHAKHRSYAKISCLATRRKWSGIWTAVLFACAAQVAQAGSGVSCGGAAMLGGAQLMCSQAKSDAPAQLCTFSWALMTEQKTSQIVEGSFLLAPQASNMQVYQGSGFAYALSAPIILCNNMK